MQRTFVKTILNVLENSLVTIGTFSLLVYFGSPTIFGVTLISKSAVATGVFYCLVALLLENIFTYWTEKENM